MTNNKPNDVRVSRELLERVSSQELGMTAKKDRQAAAQELRAILAQPADQQGEPVAVAWMRFDDDQRAIFTRSKRSKSSEPLYAHPTAYRHAQPATAKVVLPERKPEPTIAEISDPDCNYETGQSEGWNACLDEVARLNTPQ